MEQKYIISICYIVLGIINTYCFLFQRTARMIRQNAVGTQGIGIENKLLPDWYHWLLILSYIRYIPLLWLLFLDWKLAIALYFTMGLINTFWPVNHYGNIQKIRRNLFRKKMLGTFTTEDSQFESWIIQAEIKTLK